MALEDEKAELAKEWRDSITRALVELRDDSKVAGRENKEGFKTLEREILDLKSSMVGNTRFEAHARETDVKHEALAKRVEILEKATLTAATKQSTTIRILGLIWGGIAGVVVLIIELVKR